MKVTILTPDVSQNGLGRADCLARILQPRFQVTIVGPQFGDGVWAPLRDHAAAPVTGIPMARTGLRAPAEAWRTLRKSLDGDLLYVSKPFATSLWNARKAADGRPVAVDIDDWEWGSFREWWAAARPGERLREARAGLSSLHHRRLWNAYLGDRWVKRFPLRTVSNETLRRRFGGLLVPHARDTNAFDPSRFDGAAERRRLGLDDGRTLVMFLGTPRPFKGLETLAEAVGRTPSCTLAIIGRDDSPAGRRFQAQLETLASDRVRFLPAQPFSDAPRTLAAADIVAIPQAAGDATQAQIPAKLFDAMAMAKPIVASAVSDLPTWLDGCGIVTPPGDTSVLADALASLVRDPSLRQRLGEAARRRCIADASLPAARKVLLPLLESALRS